jgi:hypothetical protein
MGYFDDLLEDEPVAAQPKRRGYFDDLLEEGDAIPPSQPKPAKLAPWDTFQPKPKVEEESVFRQALDIPVNIARGGVQGIKMMTDILGADNPVSKSLSGVEGYMADLLSAQAKEDQAEISRIMQDAGDKGFGEQVKAGIKAFSIAPVDTLSQALGTMAPVLATGLAGSAAKLGSLGIRAVQTGVGAGMGAGMTKGNIYSEVKDELVKAGVGEQEAEQAAVEAQSYGGKNLDQILLGAGLGAASTIGAESIITRMLTKQGTAPTAGMVSRVLKGGFTEAIPETAQAAQEQLATNIALQREGFDVPTMRGVVSAGTMEGIAGAAMGGVFGGLERPSPLKEKTLTEENFEATNDIARKVAENGAPLTASALQDKSSSILRQDELARQLDEQLEAVKPTVAPPTAIPTKDDYVARYSAIAQVAPEELTRVEQSFTSELATAATEEARANAQNALEAIKEVKATMVAAPEVQAPTTQPATPTQPTPTDATQEIIQPEVVRPEPQDGTQVETEEAGVSGGLQPPARGEEEGQVIFGLRSVADNTATREQISALSAAGLVDIIKGQPVINEDGEAILAQAQAPLPRLTPEERVAEIEGVPAEAPAIVEQAPVVSEEGVQVSDITSEPTISEKPPTSEIVSPAPAQPAPAQAVAPVAPAPAPTIGEKPPTSPMIGAETTQPAPAEGVAQRKIVETPVKIADLNNGDRFRKDDSEYEVVDLKWSGKNRMRALQAIPVSGPAYDRYQRELEQNRRLGITGFAAQNTGKVSFSRNQNVLKIETAAEPPRAVTPAPAPAPVTEQAAPAEAPAPEVAPTRNWESYSEELRGDLESFSAARGTGRIDYDMMDVADRFVEFAKNDKSGNPLSKLVTEFSKTDFDSTTTQIKKLRTSVKSVEQLEQATISSTPAVSETITPAPTPEAPAEIAVGSRVRKTKGGRLAPNTYIIQEVLPQTEAEKRNGEQSYLVLNEKTGKIEDLNTNDGPVLVRAKGARKMAVTRASLWEAPAQEIPSAATSINAEKLPETFKRVKFEIGTINADIGGGRFNNATESLAERGVENVIYDPFNRPREWNNAAASRVSGGKADTATVNSVLNVIKEPENRERVIMQAADAVKQDGKAYFLIYEGDSSGNSRITKQKDGVAQSWQEHRKAETYIPEINKHFGNVERRGNLIIASDPIKQQPTQRMAAEGRTEKVTPVPESDRYGFEESVIEANRLFGGEIPPNFAIITDPTNKEFEFKAAYDPNDGMVILNLAYIRKGDNLQDIISHELGHYLYGDPEFQSAFEEFWNAMTPEQQALGDEIIRSSYNKNTGQIQVEEKQVRAFMSLIEEANAQPQWKRVLEAIKRWFNRVFGTEFQTTDRGALDVLAAGVKRFGSGEQIIRAEVTERRMAAQTRDARYAELEARAKAGDKEAEAEAQGMVDEAAKAAGYNQEAFHGVAQGVLEGSAFDLNKLGSNTGAASARMGIFASGKRETAQSYVEKAQKSSSAEIIANRIEELSKKVFEKTKPIRGRSLYENTKNMAENIISTIRNNKTFETFISDPFSRGSVNELLGRLSFGLVKDQLGESDPLFSEIEDLRGNIIENSELIGSRKVLNLKINIGNAFIKDYNGNEYRDESYASLIEKAKNQGYDSVIFKNTYDGGPLDNIYVVFNPNQIKSADPFTYDDAGNLIPLSERFQPATPDIRRMAVEAEPRREQVAGRTDRGTDIITTPVGIIKQTNEVLRKNFFDGTNVSDEATKNAWLYISRSLDIESGIATELAGEINNVVDAATNSKARMGASLFHASLANYAAKLAALGDDTMLSFLVRRINRMPLDNRPGDLSQYARGLRGAQEYDIDGYGALKVEQQAKRDRTAAEIFARANPTEQQVKDVSDAIDAADNATIGTPDEVASDVEQIEKRTKRNITKKLETLLKKGSLREMIASIKNTPLEEQQAPGWIEKVIKGYLEQAGLTGDAATTAAKLYDSILTERFVAAKQKAFEETLKRSAPWNNYLSRNSRMAKDSLKKIQVAIRTGVLDPSQTIESVIAKENGWDGFTKEQFEKIVQLDNIINNPDNDDVTRREAMSELNKVIVDAKLPVRFKDALGAYYVGNALMGIPTGLVNLVSPIGFTVRNMMTDIGKYAFTDPARIPIAFESFLDSMRSFYDQTSYAFKNQIYLNDVVEYLQGQNVLRELFDKGKKQWANGEYAAGFANMAVGMTQITGRVLSSLDQGAIAMLENQNITRYAMEALAASSKGKIPKDKLKEFANMVLHTKRRVIAESVASGMPRDRAGVLADLAVKSEVIAALASQTENPMAVLDASINDALLSVGRNKAITIKGAEQENTNLKDAGMLSYLPISFLETIASGSARQGSGMQIFSKMLYGFALVPARVFQNVAWFSPYGFVRLWVDSMKKKRGQDSPYAMSLQTEAQYKQRLTEAIAGSIVMLGLAALRAGSSDDEDDRQFRIVITGNGPSATTDRQYFDSWNKKWKPYSIHIVVGDTIIPINIGRGGEALFFPIMLAGAMDDWEIKKKQNDTKKEPDDLSMMASMLGSSFFALAQRGPYAAFTKPLFDASKEGRVTEELASQAGYFGKTFIPLVGTSVARNITDFINDPVDRSSVEGAIYANTPIVGPWMGAKALNALGQPVRSDDWGDKLFRLGVPVVFSFPKNTPMNELNELILKQGSGPTFPTRTNAQKRFGDILTDKEFESYVREYGKVMSDRMFKNRAKLARMKPSDYDDELERYARGYSAGDFKVKGASDMAVQAVKRMRQ